MRKKKTTNALSPCESLIMKIVWDAPQDIAVQDVITQLNERFQKDYARTTVVTFLGKMADKGYLNTYRKGRQAFVHPICDEAVYTRGIIKHDADFWFDGDSFKLMSALCSEKKLTKEEVDKIKELLDGIDC